LIILFQVQGTPASGKTALRKLLHAHILSQVPPPIVYVFETWPKKDPETLEDYVGRIRRTVTNYPDPDKNHTTFLLFDEAQDTYWDEWLWNSFFKSAPDLGYRVILFCSYGSRPVNHEIGIPLSMPPNTRISLWPKDGEGIGLLLDQLEFDEVVERFPNPV